MSLVLYLNRTNNCYLKCPQNTHFYLLKLLFMQRRIYLRLAKIIPIRLVIATEHKDK